MAMSSENFGEMGSVERGSGWRDKQGQEGMEAVGWGWAKVALENYLAQETADWGTGKAAD